jgi:hypothetical protein
MKGSQNMFTDELKGKYSPMETTIFNVLLQQGSATTDTLLRKVYPRKDAEPFNPGIIINRAVTTLGRKLQLNREPYKLVRKRRPRQRLIENRLIKKNSKESA